MSEAEPPKPTNSEGEPSKPGDAGSASESSVDAQALAQVHSTVVSIWDREADRYWVRNNLMLIVNGVLVGAALSIEIKFDMKLIASTLGVYFSWIWLMMNNKSGYYLSRWRPVIEDLEAQMLSTKTYTVLPLTEVKSDSVAFAGIRNGFARHLKVFLALERTRLSAGKLMQALIWGFVATWVAIFSLNIAPAVGNFLSGVPPQGEEDEITPGNEATKLDNMSPASLHVIEPEQSDNNMETKIVSEPKEPKGTDAP